MEEFEAIMGPPYVRNGYVREKAGHHEFWHAILSVVLFQLCFLWILCACKQNARRY
jgi:hypothetical protein